MFARKRRTLPGDYLPHLGRSSAFEEALRELRLVDRTDPATNSRVAPSGAAACRAIQHYLGHRSIASMVRYTALALTHFGRAREWLVINKAAQLGRSGPLAPPASPPPSLALNSDQARSDGRAASV